MKVYGIKNCDTVKKCLSFLQGQNITHDFIDFKVFELSENEIVNFANILGWDTLINTKSATWRGLEQSVKDNAPNQYTEIIRSNQSIVKRPLIIHNNGDITVGWNADIQEKVTNG